MKNINNNLIFALGILGVVALNVLFVSPTTTNAYKAQGGYIYCDGGCKDGSNGNTNSNNSSINDPVIYSLAPTRAEVNSNTKTITISGKGFRPDSIGRWNSSDRPTSYVSSTKLIMELNDTDTKAQGQYLVTVVNPSPEGGKFSNPKVFTVTNSTGVVAGATTTGGSTSNGGYKAPATKKIVAKKTTVKTNPAKVAVADTDSCLATATGSINDSESNNNSFFSASALNGGNSFMPSTVIGWLMLFVLIFLSVLLFRKLWITEADKNKPLKHA